MFSVNIISKDVVNYTISVADLHVTLVGLLIVGKSE